MILYLFQSQSLFTAPFQQYSLLPHHKKSHCGNAAMSRKKKQCEGDQITNLSCLFICLFVCFCFCFVLFCFVFPHFAKLTHGLDHVSKRGNIGGLVNLSVGKTKTITHTHTSHPPPDRPFELLKVRASERR